MDATPGLTSCPAQQSKSRCFVGLTLLDSAGSSPGDPFLWASALFGTNHALSCPSTAALSRAHLQLSLAAHEGKSEPSRPQTDAAAPALFLHLCLCSRFLSRASARVELEAQLGSLLWELRPLCGRSGALVTLYPRCYPPSASVSPREPHSAGSPACLSVLLLLSGILVAPGEFYHLTQREFGGLSPPALPGRRQPGVGCSWLLATLPSVHPAGWRASGGNCQALLFPACSCSVPQPNVHLSDGPRARNGSPDLGELCRGDGRSSLLWFPCP